MPKPTTHLFFTGVNNLILAHIAQNVNTACAFSSNSSKTFTTFICPKGWKLPGSATDANTIAKGTYAYLLQQYGLATAYNTGTITGTSGANGNTYDIALSPLFLVRGGFVFLYYPSTPFLNAGRTGYYWSSRAYSTTSYAYGLIFSTNVNPSYDYNRYNGYSLRCLIPTP